VRVRSASNSIPHRLLTLAARLLLIAYAIAPTFAQSDLAGYTRHLWQAPDGIPEQTVQAFAQTPDGFLWIGTTGGLLRFDGAHFTLFDRQNTPALLENNIFTLTVTRDGALWIGTEGGGLARYGAGRFRTWSARDGLSNDFIRTIAQSPDGTIWAGTDNGLLRLTGDHFLRIDGSGQIRQLAVHAIFPDSNGDLWVGGSSLLRIRGTSAQEYTLPGEASQNRVKSILRTTDGALWVGTVSGLNRLAPGADETTAKFERVPNLNATVRTLHQSANGALWIGTIGQGAYEMRGLTPTPLTAQLGLPSNTVLNFFEDTERNLWVGTQTGMLRLARTPFSIVPLPRPNDSDFGTIYRDRDNSLWIGSTDLFHLRNGAVTPEVLPGLAGIHVRNVFRDRSGILWVGTDGDGLFRIAPSGTAHFTTGQGLANNFIRAIAQDRDNSIWVACDEGISHIAGTAESPRIASYQMHDGLAYFSTRALLADSHGDLWIGTDSGLSHISRGSFVSDAATSALKQSKIWAIHEDSDGGIWFGTRNTGLFRYRSGKLSHFTTDDGLASNAIYQILEDATGRFWMSGPSGISLFRRADLDAHVDSPGRPLAVTFFSLAELSGSVEIYGGTQSSGAITPDGGVWFPSSRGPLHITPAARPTLAPPSIYLASILAGGSSLPLTAPLHLAADITRVSFNYAPIRLGSQAGIRFRYRLESFDRDWNPPTMARTAEYTNLPPGHYTFRVQAFDIDNPSAVSEASIDLVQQPHFYRTWWFLALSAALIALLIYAAYRARFAQVQARFAGVLDERSRLAREMHDTVIQGCTSVSALLEAASMEQEAGHSSSDLVEFARSQLRTTIDEARNAIWDIRQPDDDPAALSAKISHMAEQISAEFHLTIRCNTSGTPFSVAQPISHDLLMVAREAVLNAVFHGKPSLIRVHLEYTSREFTLTVTDNGSGFDTAQLASLNGHHFGLKGIEERIHRSGGHYRLQAALGKGVEITARIPKSQS
jgi:ligand-binding sensor domain-containing protein/signal transduction histidine kinase